MDNTLLDLKSKFDSMIDDLLLVESRLKVELGSMYDPEIFDIHKTCDSLKNQITRLHESIDELYEAKKELVHVLQTQINAISAVRNLQGRLNCNNADDTQIDSIVNLANHLVSQWNDRFKTTTKDVISQPLVFTIPTNTKITISKTPQETNQHIAFIPITQFQFDNVPVLTKKRATLKQVNELYEYLYNDAIKKSALVLSITGEMVFRCVPVKLKDMVNNGIQVVGQTGKALYNHPIQSKYSKIQSVYIMKLINLFVFVINLFSLYSIILSEARNANEFYTFKEATATSNFIAPNNDVQKFSANRAFQIGSSYWCSTGNHGDKEFVSWTGELWDVAKIAQVEIFWEYAPKDVEISVSLTGDNFHVVLPFTETSGDQPSYKEIFNLHSQHESKFLRLTLRGATSEYFGIRYVHIVGGGDPLFIIKSGISSTKGEMCLQLENGKTDSMTRVILDTCSHAIAAADGRELWRQDHRQRIFSAISYPPMYLTSVEPSKQGYLVVGECEDNYEACRWEFMGNSQMALKTNHELCITQVEEYEDKAGMGNLLTRFKDTVKISSNGSSDGHEEKYTFDGDVKTYWASLIYEDSQTHISTLTIDFNQMVHATRIEIDWEYQPFSYYIEASEDNTIFKHVTSNLSNSSHITLDQLGPKEFKQLRIVMLKPHYIFGKAPGGFLYGIREIQLLASNMQTVVGDCKAAANSNDARDKYFVAYVGTFDSDLSKRITSMESQLHDDTNSIMEHVANLRERLDETTSCFQEKKEYDSKMNELTLEEMNLWSNVQKSKCDAMRPVTSFLSTIGESMNNPAEDCHVIKGHNKSATSGFYWIEPKCAKHPIRVYCDMESQTSIYVWNGKQHYSMPQSLHHLTSPLSIRYQCAALGLEPLIVKTRHQIEGIKRALFLMGDSESSGSYIPLGYRFTQTGVYKDLMNIYTFLKDPISGNSKVNADVWSSKNESHMEYNAAGLSLASGTIEYFDLETATLAGIVCSTNFTMQSNQPVELNCSDRLGKYDALIGGLNTNILVNCIEDCTEKTEYPVYGTDGLYSDHSSICRAAIHAGVILTTGSFTVSIESGLTSYAGSKENNIQSFGYNLKSRGLKNLLSDTKLEIPEHFGPDTKYSIRILPLERICPIVETHGSFLQVDPASTNGDKVSKSKQKDDSSKKQDDQKDDFDLLTFDPITRQEAARCIRDIDSLYGVDPKTIMHTIEQVAVVVSDVKKHLKPLESISNHQEHQLQVLSDRMDAVSSGAHHLKENSESHRFVFEKMLRDESKKGIHGSNPISIDYKSMAFDKTFLVYDTTLTHGGGSNWGYSNSPLEGHDSFIVQQSNLDASQHGEGSYAFLKSVQYANFEMNVDILSRTEGKIGVAFHVQDHFNYYLLVLDYLDSTKRLIKVQNGIATVLATNHDEGYIKNQWMQIKIVLVDYIINVSCDNQPVLSALDTSFVYGGLALYSCGSNGSFYFDKFSAKPLESQSVTLEDRLKHLSTLKCGEYRETYQGNFKENYEIQTPLWINTIFWGYSDLIGNKRNVIIQRNSPADTLGIGSVAIISNDMFCTQGYFEFRSMPHCPNGTIGAVVGYKDIENMILIELSSQGLTIRHLNGIKARELAHVNEPTLKNKRWNRIKITVSDKNLKVKVDDMEQETSVDIGHLKNIGTRIGLKSSNCHLSYFDDIQVSNEAFHTNSSTTTSLIQRSMGTAFMACVTTNHILSRLSLCQKMYRNNHTIQKCSKDFCEPCCEYHTSLLSPQEHASCIHMCRGNSQMVKDTITKFLSYVSNCTSFKGPGFSHCNEV
ncbi:bifunctional Ricin B [Babesia duncani]|uniref:Bifunctional Ricin B n=1 Tax=Babesia duncani TaxID=323732 RepID=A0AAD9UP73_9APIC|nr:bifunctional Ricin B [Babesia duncani]